MEIIERKPVPKYEAVCSECRSKIRYIAAEVSWCSYITCPVCGKSIWASTINPVAFDESE